MWDGSEFFCGDRNGQCLPEHQASVSIMPLSLGELLPPTVRAASANRLEREFLGACDFRKPWPRPSGDSGRVSEWM
jgi:hypothetical protein